MTDFAFFFTYRICFTKTLPVGVLPLSPMPSSPGLRSTKPRQNVGSNLWNAPFTAANTASLKTFTKGGDCYSLHVGRWKLISWFSSSTRWGFYSSLSWHCCFRLGWYFVLIQNLFYIRPSDTFSPGTDVIHAASSKRADAVFSTNNRPIACGGKNQRFWVRNF